MIFDDLREKIQEKVKRLSLSGGGESLTIQ